MKKFITKLMFFLIPIILFFVGLELFVQNDQNSFKTIAKYFDKNKANAEVLILGSSHHQNGLNPEFFIQNTINISYGAQDIKSDSALFFHNIKAMKNLKTVIFELDYHRMDIEYNNDFYRYPWYYFYYDLEVVPIKWYNKISLYSSNPTFFNELIKSKLEKSYKKQIINKFGYVTDNYTDQFKIMKYDSIKIFNTAKDRLKDRHKELSAKAFAKNKERIEALIKYCKQNKIKLCFLSTPVLKSYSDSKIEVKKNKILNLINELKIKHNILYFDFQNDTRFNINDFRNDDHLNVNGAKKYSLIINNVIRNY
jgi:hypothetical protein